MHVQIEIEAADSNLPSGPLILELKFFKTDLAEF